MTNSTNDLKYVRQTLEKSIQQPSIASIYYLWCSIVLFGYLIAEFNLAWINVYWLIAAPVGFVISAWIGYRYSQKLGQSGSDNDKQYLWHFGLLILFTFSAMLTQQYLSIMLLIGLGYCLAGIHLERAMMWPGLMALALYFGIHFQLITSQLLIGGLFAAAFFITGWSINRFSQPAI